jgi:nucleotide-binding universal stress UspA family protein
MKILLAADGSEFTQKALDFLVLHKTLIGAEGGLEVLYVQTPVPALAASMLGAADVAAYYREEIDKVLPPIQVFLNLHNLRNRCTSVVGLPVDEILKAAADGSAELIVMGTHGHNLVARALMGSIAQRVVVGSAVPVLLVK